MLKTLIVEDELLARDLLRRWLSEHPEINVTGEANSLPEAKKQVKQSMPELIFLDVNLLGENGFSLLDELPESGSGNQPPHIIFVTAYADYALQAFRVNAVDYLHKPFGRDQLDEAIQRVLLRHSAARLDQTSQRIAIKENGRTLYVNCEDIQWIESAGGYCVLHTDSQHHVHRDSLVQLDKTLGDNFARVHRSAIVNMDYIASIESLQHGDGIISLYDGTTVRLSRRYRPALNTLSHPAMQ